jgi:nicotinamidase-related amidase
MPYTPQNPVYADPSDPALPPSTFVLDIERVALVITDPQIDFLGEGGAAYPVFAESIAEQGTVPNLARLMRAARDAGIPIIISPHYYYPHDDHWQFNAPGEALMHKLGMFQRKSPLSLDGFEGSGADWLPELKDVIEDPRTVVCSPHKIAGPQTNDTFFQLRKTGATQVILAGMAANFCVESHLRDFVEHGLEVAVVRDATAGSKIPEGDAYAAALLNFRWFANALWSTDDAVALLADHAPA